MARVRGQNEPLDLRESENHDYANAGEDPFKFLELKHAFIVLARAHSVSLYAVSLLAGVLVIFCNGRLRGTATFRLHWWTQGPDVRHGRCGIA